MINDSTIVVTGAAGFIGSVFVQYLNENGFEKIYLVDDFSSKLKKPNWEFKIKIQKIDRIDFLRMLESRELDFDIIIHLGARTDTTEFNYSIHEELNLIYTKKIWEYAAINNIPMIYASSAATYGSGENGYLDDHNVVEKLKPLNPYGISKNELDKWAIIQRSIPKYWVGLKFFNVYGPNEGHKGRMASVIYHAYNQIKTTGVVELFKSYRTEFENGKQLRDFIYVKDLVDVIFWIMNLMLNKKWEANNNGLYNLGTGNARSFYDLACNTFIAQGKNPNIKFIDMPIDIRNNYQYFTEANMNKLYKAGYTKEFTSLEDGVKDYVVNYLTKGIIY